MPAIGGSETMPLISKDLEHKNLEMLAELLFQGFYDKVGLVLDIVGEMDLDLLDDVLDGLDLRGFETADFAHVRVFGGAVGRAEDFLVLLLLVVLHGLGLVGWVT